MVASIIITTYNNEEHIAQTIESVKKQTFKDWNCVIVDNGSLDSTFELTKEIIRSDPRFFSYLKSNEGPSAGRNFGFNKLPESPIYVHFLDGDDMLHPDFLSKMISYLYQHPNVGLVGCQYDIYDSAGQYIRAGRRSRYAPGIFKFPTDLSDVINKTPFETFFSATGQGAFALFRTSIFEQTSGYECSFWSHEDSDIFCQMALMSEVHYLPEKLYRVRIRENSLTYSPKANYNNFRKKWDLFKSSDERINILIEKALYYYYTRHKPLRDFKVAFAALEEYVKTKKLEKLKWSFTCLKTGLSEIFLKKSLKKIMVQRTSLLVKS